MKLENNFKANCNFSMYLNWWLVSVFFFCLLTTKEANANSYCFDFNAPTDQGFTTENLGTTPQEWDRGTPSGGTNAPGSANSPPNCWGTNLSGNQANDPDYALVSPEFIANSSDIEIDFYEHVAIDAGWHEQYFEYRINSGSWTTEWMNDQNVQPWALNQNTITGFTPGDTVQFRWRSTNDGIGVQAGWYVDNVRVDNVDIVPTTDMQTMQIDSVFESGKITDLVLSGATNSEILTANFNATGILNAPDVHAFYFNTATTDNVGDIENARLFVNGVQFGTAVSNPSGSFSFQDTLELSTCAAIEGFQLVYDIDANASSGNQVDAQFDSVIVNSTVHYPTITGIAGAREISSPLSGVYTVGAGEDFETITDAVSELTLSGINNTVEFHLTDANYSSGENFPIVIESFANVNNDTVVFRPDTNVDVTIEGNESALFVFDNNAEHVKFDGAGPVSNERSLNIRNQANSDAPDVVFAITGNSEHISLLNMNIHGGFSGIGIADAQNLFIHKNEISEISVSDNTAPPAIFMEGNVENVTIDANEIFDIECTNTFRAGQGIFIDVNSTTANIQLSNNLIYDLRGNGSNATGNNSWGIYIDGGGGFDIYYNTIVMNGENTNSSSTPDKGGVWISDGDNINFVNNVIYAPEETNPGGNGTMYAFYSDVDETHYNSIDHNIYYSSSSQGVLGHFNGTDYTDIAGWQGATNDDANSFDDNPLLFAPDNHDFRPMMASPIIDNGTPITGITTDIDGEPRSTVDPYIGAHETTPPQNDAGITDISSACQGVHMIEVEVTNFGIDTLNEITLNWSVDGAPQNDTTYTGLGVEPISSITLDLGEFNFTTGVNYDIVVSTSMPNGSADEVPENDTLHIPNYETGLEGVYAIGGASADYNTITDALNDLNLLGSCGNVTFELHESNYSQNEMFPLTIDDFGGDDSLSILPASGVSPTIEGNATAIFHVIASSNVFIDGSNDGSDSRDLTLNNTSGASNTAVFWLQSDGSDGVSGMTIENVVMNGSDWEAANTTGIFVGDDVTNLARGTGATDTYSDAQEGAGHENLAFINNHVYNVHHGIYAAGTSGSLIDNLMINENEIGHDDDANRIGWRGVAVTNAENVTVNHNHIHNLYQEVDESGRGIHFIGNVSNSEINANKIHNISTDDSFDSGQGIWLTDDASNIVISNNVIYDLRGESSTSASEDNNPFGIVIEGNSSGIELYYNTIASTTPSQTGNDVGALLLQGNATSLTIENNIFMTTIDGQDNFAVYADDLDASDFISIDHNLYYSDDALGILDGTTYSDLSSWQTATGDDANSINADPQLISFDTYKPAAGSPVIASGTPITGVGSDFEGTSRDASNPAIGAFESTSDFTDLAAIEISGICDGTSDILLLVENQGATVIDSFEISWEFEGSLEPDINVTGANLAPGEDTIITLGSQTFSSGQTYNVMAFTSNPNGQTDDNPDNDTATYNAVPGMEGTFAIGGSSPDFATITDAMNAVNTAGICGPVTFELHENEYTESTGETFPIHVTQFPNLNDDMVTVVPASGIEPTIEANADAIFHFDGASYVTVDGSYSGSGQQMTVRNLSNNEDDYVFEVNNGSENITLQNMNLRGGFTGVYMNEFSNGLIHNNEISEISVAVSTSPPAIHMEGNVSNVVVDANEIHDIECLNSFRAGQGIVIDVNDNASAGITLSNNLIYDLRGESSASNANNNWSIIVWSGGGINIYHNTIAVSGLSYSTGTASHEFGGIKFDDNGSDNLELVNNIIYYTWETTDNDGTGYAVFSEPDASAFNNIDHNIYWSNGPQHELGYMNGTDYSDLTAWQGATGSDANSIEADPVLQDVASDLYKPMPASPAVDAGTPIALVTTDIDGNARSATDPYIGSYETFPPADDLGAVDIIEPASAQTCPDANQPVSVLIQNFGIVGQANFDVVADIYFEGSQVGTISNTYTDSIMPGETDTIDLGNANMSFPGNYTIVAYTDLSGDANPDNDETEASYEFNPVPAAPQVSDQQACGESEFTFTTSSDADHISWFAADDPNTVIQTGDTLQTSLISETTEYFAVAQNDQSFNIGAPDNNIGTGGNYNFDHEGIYFDVFETVTIDSVTVYPDGAGDFDVVLEDDQNNVVDQTNVTVPGSGEHTVYVGFTVSPGTDYLLVADNLTTGGLYRNTGGSAFPYEEPGIMTLTGSTIGTNYYFLYNWSVSSAGCPSEPGEFTAEIIAAPEFSALEGVPFEGTWNDGTELDPDRACAGDQLTYEMQPPAGYTNDDYNSEWVISDWSFETEHGTTPLNMTFDAPTSADNAQISYIADETEEDSTFILSVTVQLTASGCENMKERVIYIEENPEADFNVQNVCAGQSVSFDNQSTVSQGTLIYEWNFGDGQTSTDENPTHVYDDPGNYTVTLSAQIPGGCVDIHTATVEVMEGTEASFTTDVACENDSVHFDNHTQGSGTINYEWDFGDGNNSTDENPAHVYAATGTYDVTLVSTSDNGCVDSVTSSVEVHTNPEPEFSYDLTCNNDYTEFTNESTGADNYEWTFNGGIISNSENPTFRFGSPGSYDVTLTAYSQEGCAASITETVEVHERPDASFDVNAVCQGDSARFVNTSDVEANDVSYEWTFGDGNTSEEESPAHYYEDSGSYEVLLVVEAGSGCRDSVTHTVEVHGAFDAEFTYEPACAGESITFENVSDRSAEQQWYVDGELFSANASPSYIFTEAGEYEVTLVTSSTEGCMDEVSQTVEVPELPNSDFTINKEEAGITVEPEDEDHASYLWNFGDGNESESVIPGLHTYEANGTYFVSLTVTNDIGCENTSTDTVTIRTVSLTNIEMENFEVNGYPNPFHSEAVVTYNLQDQTNVSGYVYDLQGQRITTLVEGENQSPGNYSLDVNAEELGLAEGMYIVRLEFDGEPVNIRLEHVR